ncbi:MAG: MBL fold metallo-hydrolase [Christensenella sp.]|uniref:MBL fold metallo-hydrolase n=1 Tax=Christensenella sp. TaxID=1935934 RepID=UPI002B1F9C8E|nr:MBL fold metallo-hydrolase [Christensenella sp.]MEA5003935.1 MBL fold metallo-hydrolase [Christensenella sp.]
MQLTILGKYGPYPKAGGATTSCLVECCGKKILLDAGSGSLSRVQEYCSLDDLDMVLLTHLHSDHCADMFVLRYAPLKNTLPIYLPATPAHEHDTLAACEKFEPADITEALTLEFPDTDLQISFCKTLHPVECYAVKFCSEGKTFVFSGDSRYSEHLTDFCRNADVVMLDSGFLKDDKPKKILPHMTVIEAAQTAKTAGAGKLLLTHINPAYDEAELLCEACEVFQNTTIVQEKRQYTI